MKIAMRRGDSCEWFGVKFDTQPPVISFENDYIWVGGLNGPCYATLSGRAKLRKLAKEILRKHPERKRERP